MNPTAAGEAPVDRPVRPSPYRHFEGMAWPVPGERLDELESLLRFADRNAVLAMDERLVIASYLSAYRELVALPGKVRDARVRELRKGPRTSYGTLPGPNVRANLPATRGRRGHDEQEDAGQHGCRGGSS